MTGTHTPGAGDPIIRVGRALDNDVVVPDRRVSRYHLEIQHGGDHWEVRDLGSGNGTELNGEPVHTAEAHVGDLLRVGSTRLRLSATGVEFADEAASLTDSPTTLSSPEVTVGPHYRPGDVANGHRLSPDGMRWEPLPTPTPVQDAHRGSGDTPVTSTRPRRAMKVGVGIAGVAVALSVAAGLLAIGSSRADSSVQESLDASAQDDLERQGSGSSTETDVQARIDAAAERDRQRSESPEASTTGGISDAPDIRSQARDIWSDLRLNEQDLACNAYYNEGPGMVRIALTSSGYDDEVIRQLLGMMDGELCEPVYFEYEYRYEYVPPVPSGPRTGGVSPPPPPSAWSGPNFSPTYPSTPDSLSSDNFGW